MNIILLKLQTVHAMESYLTAIQIWISTYPETNEIFYIL